MKIKLKLFLSLFFLSSKLMANDPYSYSYNMLDSNFIDKPGSVKEINPTTPIKSQDGIGFCYGFSATSLLESLRCRELKRDCSNPAEFLSTFDVTSRYKGELLKEGGDTYKLLHNIEKSNLKIAKEECIQFSTLVYKIKEANSDKETLTNEKQGWNFLVKIWNDHKGIGLAQSNDCISCQVNQIVNTLSNVKTPEDQLRDALYSASSLGEFLYKSILPLECLQEKNMAAVPPFVAKTFPEDDSDFSEAALKERIKTLLNSNLPIEMSICADDLYTVDCKDRHAHSIALYGIKEACHKITGECRTMVQVKNSYGLRWQQQNNDGWVDLDSLMKSSTSFSHHKNISWIENP